AGGGEIIAVPACVVPPQFLQGQRRGLAVNKSCVHDMLGALQVENVACRGRREVRRPGSSREVVVVPAVGVPPKLMRMPVVAVGVHHVLSALGFKHISRRFHGRSWRGRRLCSQILQMPSTHATPSFTCLAEPATAPPGPSYGRDST